MSKYEQMYEACELTRREWFAHRDRCLGYITSLVNGFSDYCEIPYGRLTFLRSNDLSGEEKQYTQPDDGERYTLMDAIKYDEEDGYWHLGIGILLTPPGRLPSYWVSFALCVTENNEKATIKIGWAGKPLEICIEDSDQCDRFYEWVCENIKQSFGPRKSTQLPIGFDARISA